MVLPSKNAAGRDNQQERLITIKLLLRSVNASLKAKSYKNPQRPHARSSVAKAMDERYGSICMETCRI